MRHIRFRPLGLLGVTAVVAAALSTPSRSLAAVSRDPSRCEFRVSGGKSRDARLTRAGRDVYLGDRSRSSR